MKPSRSYPIVPVASRASVLMLALLCLIVTLLLAALLIEPVHAQKKLTAAEAKDHIGETATVAEAWLALGTWLQRKASRHSSTLTSRIRARFLRY